MKYKNYSVYDDDDFFEQYNLKRSKGNSPNETVEQPVMDELIGSVSKKKILDLGCGDGKYGFVLLDKGAAFYHGMEGSVKMAGLAKDHLRNQEALISVGDIENLDFGKSDFDLVVSRLVLHYIENLESLMLRIHESLKINGQFIFSIEHPLITSCYDAYHQKPKRGNWIVDNYFNEGERINTWIGKDVVKYHKSLEQYWKIISEANFTVLEIRESKPFPSNFKEKEEYERRKRIPLFLMFKLLKNN